MILYNLCSNIKNAFDTHLYRFISIRITVEEIKAVNIYIILNVINGLGLFLLHFIDSHYLNYYTQERINFLTPCVLFYAFLKLFNPKLKVTHKNLF